MGRLAPGYLVATTRREWPLALLALVSLAPGVAALTAWLQLAWTLRGQVYHPAELGWLLPPALLDAITPAGVLVGSGVVTLLIGCLGLSNAYLASVERRLGDLALLMSLGLRRAELAILLLGEAMGLALLGTASGLLAGVVLTAASWLSAKAYFELSVGFAIYPQPLLVAGGAGILATLLFVGITAIATILRSPLGVLQGMRLRHLMLEWSQRRLSALGTLFAGLLTGAVALLVLEPRPALVLTGLALGLAALLNLGAWILTRFYWRLPTPETAPQWALAIQGLAQHRRQTAGITLAMTAGALGVGLAALAVASGSPGNAFPIWIVALLLASSATLVLTAAALAALERRQELGLLAALGARPGWVRRLILLEYGIVALGGGSLGALLALLAWLMVRGTDQLAVALAVALADVLAALLAAWLGAAPVLWLVTRRPPGQALRDRPWFTN
jgi:predicted lysophospholipase L1 biosynthesis ABC-type transport system permease subunit